MSVKPTAAEIRQRMRDVRSRIPAELVIARAEVRQAFDWKHHVGKHPLAVLGLTMGLGYLLVPRRKLVLNRVSLPLGRPGRHVNVSADESNKTVAKASLASMLISTITTFLLRTGTSFATQQLLKRLHPPPTTPTPEYSRW